MNFKRKTQRMSGLPIVFYTVAIIFFVALIFFNTSYFKPTSVVLEEKNKDSIQTVNEPLAITEPDIYIPDVEVLPPSDTIKTIPQEEEKKQEPKEEKKEKVVAAKTEPEKNSKSENSDKSDKEKITKIGTERKLIAFIPGTMGKEGKLPNHNCKTKGELVMFIIVNKDGVVTNAGRSSGIKDECNITAAVIWLKQYVKAKKSQNISQGTYTIKF